MIYLTPKKIPTHLTSYNQARIAEGLKPISEEEALTAWMRDRPYKYDPHKATRRPRVDTAQKREDEVLASLDDTDPVIRMLRGG